MARIMVTGASGYIGNVLVDKLLKENHQVVAVDWMIFGGFPLRPFLENPNFELLNQDIREIPVRAFRGVDMICDVSGLPNEQCCALDPVLTREINVQARARIARISKAIGVKRHVTLTSCEAYNVPCGETATEHSPVRGKSPYTKSNNALEHAVLSSAADGFCPTILRVGSVYGLSRRMRFDTLVNLIALHAHLGRSFTLPGTEQNSLPVIHVRDVARGVLATLEASETEVSGQMFNLGSANLTFADMAEQANQVFPDKVSFDYAPSTETFPEAKVSFDALSNSTEFSPRISLDQGMMEVLIALKGGRTELDETTNTAKFYRSLIKKGAAREGRRLT